MSRLVPGGALAVAEFWFGRRAAEVAIDGIKRTSLGKRAWMRARNELGLIERYASCA